VITPLRTRILQALSQAPAGLLTREVATGAGEPLWSTSATLAALEDAGEVVAREDRQAGAIRWELAETGGQAA
jgi:DNA-binding IclR family transcriptional regulator